MTTSIPNLVSLYNPRHFTASMLERAIKPKAPPHHRVKRNLTRDEEVVRLRVVDGLTLAEIGDRTGVTRERVRQIIRDAAATEEGKRRQREVARQKREEQEEAIRDEVLRLFGENLLTQIEIADFLGITINSVRRIVGSSDIRIDTGFKVKGRLRQSEMEIRHRRRASRAQMILCLREAHRQLCAEGGRMRCTEDYEPFARKRGWIGPQSVCKEFGTWNAALAEAGLPHMPVKPGGRSDRTPIEALDEALKRCAVETGNRYPTLNEYERWARQQRARGLFCPSGVLIRSRHGGRWANVIRRMVELEAGNGVSGETTE